MREIVNRRIWYLAVGLAALGLFLAVGSNKRISFCDEIYTYTIVNSDTPTYQFTADVWYDRAQITDMLSRTDSDSLRGMLANVKGDMVHPPLYYGLVYLVSVVFGGSISTWVGLSVNGLFFVGAALVFFAITDRLFHSRLMAAAAAAVYMLNVSTLSDMSLIRMYMQMTFFAIAFAYVMLLLYENQDGKGKYIWLAVVTAGGFLTHYYFALFAIIFFLAWVCFCIFRRQYAAIGKYLISMGGAVAASTLIWPYWIAGVLSGTHSDAIYKNAQGIGGIVSDLFRGVMLVQGSVFQKGYIVGGCLALVVVIAFFVSRLTVQSERTGEHGEHGEHGKDAVMPYAAALAAVTLLYAGIVYRITPEYLRSSRYFYVADMLELLCMTVCVCGLLKTIKGCTGRMRVGIGAAVGVVCLILDMAVFFTGYGIDYYGDASLYDDQREQLEKYADIPWIICGGETWHIDANFFDYTIPEKLMMITPDSDYRKDDVLEALGGFLIVAYEDREDQKNSDLALYYYIGSTGNFAASEFIMERGGLNYYFAYPVK